MIYNWNGSFELERFQDFINFYNTCLRNGDSHITLYLDSKGGEYAVFSPLLDLLNSHQMAVTLIASEHIGSSAATLFFLFTGNKKLLNGCTSTFHLIDMSFSKRESISKTNIYHEHCMQVLKECNDHLNAKLIKNKVFKEKYYDQYILGHEVYLTHQETLELFKANEIGNLLN